jgi:hypothetical protein
MDYKSFLESKRLTAPPAGLAEVQDLHPSLFDWQAAIVRWALKRGRAAMFADCGLGKTFMQLEWARHIPGDVLLLTPLAVGHQTVREAQRFGIDAALSRDGKRAAKITVTNYEKLHLFQPGDYAGVVLDESSILKNFTGSIRNRVIEAFHQTPYRLACTATPAPNDYMELGNHAEFLGIMSRTEMLASFFVHDSGDTSEWRVKGHAEEAFWRWVASWACMMRRPSDIGYDDAGFDLPPLRFHEHIIEVDAPLPGELFTKPAESLHEQRCARRLTLDQRVAEVAKLIKAEPDEPWLVWCELNDEGDELARIPNAVQIAGKDDDDAKAERMLGFTNSTVRILVSKPKLAGFGMNWQHCARVAFVGLSHSYEQFYQAIRRCWRFGQTRPVDVHIISSSLEIGILDNVKSKQAIADQMAEGMIAHMNESMKVALGGTDRERDDYRTGDERGDGWTLHLGDCVERVRDLPDASIDFSIFSPPFASLYTYSNSERDMGNSKDGEEFWRHFAFLAVELARVIKPGRLVSIHCMNLPTSKVRHGHIGIQDFRGDVIRAMEAAGMLYHSEVCIWKDPVTAMQRTKALGLLHKTIEKDSCMSRQGIPDYVCTFRKPGENSAPVAGRFDRFVGPDGPVPTGDARRYSIDVWQRYASPVWMDINQSRTLQRESAREEEDEKHICPLQLDVIERCVELWSNPGDLVLSPFAGIGSEGYVAIEAGRRFVGIELKPSYFAQAVKNLRAAAERVHEPTLFDGPAE